MVELLLMIHLVPVCKLLFALWVLILVSCYLLARTMQLLLLHNIMSSYCDELLGLSTSSAPSQLNHVRNTENTFHSIV